MNGLGIAPGPPGQALPLLHRGRELGPLVGRQILEPHVLPHRGQVGVDHREAKKWAILLV